MVKPRSLLVFLILILCLSLIFQQGHSTFAADTDRYISIENGSFEEPLGEDGTIPGWEVVIGETTYFKVTDEMNAPDGTYILKVTDPSATSGAGLETHTVDITPGETYEATAMVRAPNGRIGLYLRFYDSEGNRVGNDSEFTTSIHKEDWAPLSLANKAPESAAQASVLIYSTIAGTAEGYADDVKLEEVEQVNIGTFTNLGTQITRAVIPSAAIAQDNSGTNYMHVAVNGDPAKLTVINMEDEVVEKILDLPGAVTAWDMETGDDGNVYIGGSRNGHLYRYKPGSDELEDLGSPAGVTHIWDIKNGKDGKMYFGAYPGGNVIEFDTTTDTFTDLGQMIEGEQYARSLDYDSEQDVLYVGIGADTHLIKYDLKTGEKTDILPEKYKDRSYPMSVDVAGDKIVVYLEKTSTMFVMDKNTGEVEYEDEDARQRTIKSPHDNKIYYKADEHLKYYDPDSQTTKSLVDLKSNVYPRNMTFVQLNEEDFPGQSLVVWLGSDTLLKYNVQTGNHDIAKIQVPGQPNEIRSISKGPDGKIYSGGYLGGTGIYDPITEKIESFAGVSQAEAMTTMGSYIYFGVYPGARIVEYDTALPWDMKNENPKNIYEFPLELEQDRPFGMLGVEDENKLFIGTVPAYGKLEGAFSIYDFTTGSLEHTEKNIVHNQSVVSLAYKDGKVYGGTSIWGGLGIQPSEKEGKLFVWDVAAAQKEREIVPVPGKRAVTGLTVGPDGNIWGMAEGYLFILDPQTNEIVYSEQVIPVQYGDTVWGDAYLEIGTDGNIYGTSRGKFFRINVETKEVTLLSNIISDAKFLAQDDFGNLYFQRDSSDLWKYTNDDLLLKLSEVKLSVPKTSLQPSDAIELEIAAFLEKGRKLSSLEDAAIDYISSNTNIVSVEDGLVTAHKTGHADIYVEVTINGVTVRSNQLTFHVEPNAVYMQERLDAYLNSGDLKNPLYVQLTNSLKQATHHKNNGRQAQALKHLERFLQHLHNEVMEKFISQSAKDKLIRDANQLLQVWSSK